MPTPLPSYLPASSPFASKPGTPAFTLNLPTPKIQLALTTPLGTPGSAILGRGGSVPSASTSNTTTTRASMAVVFLFDTSLGREAFVKNTTGEGSVVGGIVSGLVERGKNRAKATKSSVQDKGKEKSVGEDMDGFDLRISIVITHSTQPGTIPNFTSSLFADPFDQTQSPIVYQQYFVPYSTFLASLPLLSTYFPVLPLASASTSGSGPGIEKDGVRGTYGYDDDIGWLSEFGIDPEIPVGGVMEEKTVSAEKGLKGLLEGLVVGLEMFDANVKNPFRPAIPVTFMDKTLKAGDVSIRGTPASSFAQSTGQRISPARTDEAERFLFVLTARDAVLPQRTESPSKETSDATVPAWKRTTSADEAEANQTLGPSGHTGLPSPSPSPEDGERRKPKPGTLTTMEANKETAVSTSMLDTPAETSPAAMTTTVQESRVSGSSLGCRLVGNTDAKYDYTTWRDLPDLYSALQVAVALVETEVDANAKDVAQTSLIRSLVASAEGRLDKTKSTAERETSWWPDVPGGRSAMGGFIKHKYAVESEVERPKPVVESVKNANGKRPISAAASPLEQDLANEAKRFKADAAAAASAQQAKMTAQSQSGSTPGNRNQAILGGNTSAAAAAVLGLNGTFTPAQISAIQQARAQHLLKRKQSDAQKRAIAPMPAAGSNPAAQQLNAAQLQQAALTLQNPGAGQIGGSLNGQQGVLQMQALQNEVLRQQAARAAASQPENGAGTIQQGGPHPLGSAVATTAQPTTPSGGPQREVPIWHGRLMAVPAQSEQADTLPSVVAISMRGTDPSTYMPQSWPAAGSTLTLTGAKKLDMNAVQSLAKRGRCPFVEFRAHVESSQTGDLQAQASNNRAVSQFAAKLASGNLMFIYTTGPTPGGGLVVVPHRSSNGTARLLGACFFATPIPANLGEPLTAPGIAPRPGGQNRAQQPQLQRAIQPAIDGSLVPQPALVQPVFPPQSQNGQAPFQNQTVPMVQQQPQQQMQRPPGPPGGTGMGNFPPQILDGLRAALQVQVPGMDVNSLPPEKLAMLANQLTNVKHRQQQQQQQQQQQLLQQQGQANMQQMGSASGMNMMQHNLPANQMQNIRPGNQQQMALQMAMQLAAQQQQPMAQQAQRQLQQQQQQQQQSYPVQIPNQNDLNNYGMGGNNFYQ